MPRIELLYTTRGTHAEFNGEALGTTDLGYLDIPLLLRTEYQSAHATFYGILGSTFSILLNAEQSNAAGAVSNIKDELNELDVSLSIGAGLEFAPFSWGTFNLESRYDHGLFNIDKLSGLSFKNRTISLMLGYEYRRKPRGPKDSDHDGIFDDLDQCRDQPEDINDFEDDDGCPDADKDADRDGVLDVQDQCRGQAEDTDGIRDDDGCPDPDLDPQPDTGTDSDSPPEDNSDDAPADRTPTTGGKPKAMLHRGPVCPKLPIPPLTTLPTSFT